MRDTITGIQFLENEEGKTRSPGKKSYDGKRHGDDVKEIVKSKRGKEPSGGVLLAVARSTEKGNIRWEGRGVNDSPSKCLVRPIRPSCQSIEGYEGKGGKGTARATKSSRAEYAT